MRPWLRNYARRIHNRSAVKARRAVRPRIFAALGHYTPYVAVMQGDVAFLASTRNHGVGRSMFVLGRRPELVVLERAVRVLQEQGRAVEGSLLVDVGANIGTTSLLAVARHGFGRALAIEPDPDNVRLLAANAALNGLDDRISVVRAAASSEPGKALFGRGGAAGALSDGTGSLAKAKKPRPGRAMVDVEVTTVDRELGRAGDPKLGLLWIDTQGHEHEVLLGAERTLSDRTPLVLAWRPAKLAVSRPLGALLARHGYTAFVDLRQPNLYGKAPWEPAVRPLDTLDSFARDGATTDVLVL